MWNVSRGGKSRCRLRRPSWILTSFRHRWRFQRKQGMKSWATLGNYPLRTRYIERCCSIAVSASGPSQMAFSHPHRQKRPVRDGHYPPTDKGKVQQAYLGMIIRQQSPIWPHCKASTVEYCLGAKEHGRIKGAYDR